MVPITKRLRFIHWLCYSTPTPAVHYLSTKVEIRVVLYLWLNNSASDTYCSHEKFAILSQRMFSSNEHDDPYSEPPNVSNTNRTDATTLCDRIGTHKPHLPALVHVNLTYVHPHTLLKHKFKSLRTRTPLNCALLLLTFKQQ